MSDYPAKSRSIALAVKTCYGSLYYSNSSIENCEFYNFGNGIYQCGDRSYVRGCYFESCYKGIYSDGSVHNVFDETSNLLCTVDNTTYTVPEISIPENIDDIENGEYFYLKIPDNYTESAVTTIYYNGGSCMLYEAMPSDQSQYEGSIYTTIPTDKAGQYAVLKLFVEDSNYKFILYGYAKL